MSLGEERETWARRLYETHAYTCHWPDYESHWPRLVPALKASWLAMADVVLRDRDALAARVEALTQELTDLRDGREWAHMTYNGGHHEKETHAAFHHGMDTVFNIIGAAAERAALASPSGGGAP